MSARTWSNRGFAPIAERGDAADLAEGEPVRLGSPDEPQTVQDAVAVWAVAVGRPLAAMRRDATTAMREGRHAVVCAIIESASEQ